MGSSMPENWNALTWEQKRQVRFDWWLSTEGKQFVTLEAEQNYKKTVQMFIDAITLKKPERVPIYPLMGFYIPQYAGFTAKEVEYDYEKLGIAYSKFNKDFGFDSLVGSSSALPGKLFDRLDMKFYNWPGHGVPDTTTFQAVEREYMRADEYDALLADPSGWFLHTYLPRTLGNLQGLQMFPPLTFLWEIVTVGIGAISMGTPPVQEALKTLLEAGQIGMEWAMAVGAIDSDSTAALGKPSLGGGFSKAPFDVVGDTLRGSRGVMLDMYRQPAKVIEACEKITPMAIQWGLNAANASKGPFVVMPLHKGADGFMSQKDFDRFYWPSLKAVMKAYINEGLVPCLFVEGGYNSRLDAIVDPEIPEGSVWFMFDQTDMAEAKKKLGGYACISGNVPSSLISTGTPDQVENYVKDLIEVAGKDGGYILSNGAVIDEAKPENLHAMIEAGRKYGVY